jgi:hypothetical protein
MLVASTARTTCSLFPDAATSPCAAAPAQSTLAACSYTVCTKDNSTGLYYNEMLLMAMGHALP